MKKVLFIPSLKKKGGTGHLRRCLRLLSLLGPESRILAPAETSREDWSAGEILSRFGPGLQAEHFVPATRDGWDYILFDRRETSREDFFRLSQGRPALGLDEGGEARPLFTCLIDTFPRLSRVCPGNIRDEGLVAEGSPKALRFPPVLGTALLSFGGEDPAGLTEITLKALEASGLFAAENTGVVAGPAFTAACPPFVQVYAGLKDIRPLFAGYDCVFTSFGITPYEALKEGVLPILVNPSGYHEKLSRKAGFVSLGVRRVSRKRLKKIAASPGKALSRLGTKKLSAQGLRNILEDFSPSGPPVCPLCGGAARKPLYRNREATFFRCSGCGLSYREGFSTEPIRYDRNYFFADYCRQYGKTYLEDFPAIAAFARKRLAVLASLCGGLRGKTLLDIGCAYGPFVASAQDSGCLPRGIDVAEDAVRHVQNVLKIPALQGDFLLLPPSRIAAEGPYDIITLWFVIEHFRSAAGVLRKTAELLKKGGFLAFSTPNSAGVSGLFSRKNFFETSPRDHCTLWNPRSARSVLERFGFRVRKIRVTGHHPERFPRFLRLLLGLRGCGALSRMFGLGDTFEVYAEKCNG
jgi:2-polyprenyl-3-methyl-5-hydroxy-6-metoxy-1,4-benzoquinol methylase/spore coat polysaccharide biosynthesis predicted glycosyltransferase SpsG